MKITKNYFGKFYINQLIRSFDYILLFIIFLSRVFNVWIQWYVYGKKLYLSCDLFRITLSIKFGWLYFYEKYKSQDIKQISSPFTNPWLNLLPKLIAAIVPTLRPVTRLWMTVWGTPRSTKYWPSLWRHRHVSDTWDTWSECWDERDNVERERGCTDEKPSRLLKQTAVWLLWWCWRWECSWV